MPQLILHLRQWTKGSKTMDEYMQGFITRFDQIALLGKPIDREDQLEYIFGGLHGDYKTILDQVQGRDMMPSFTEVHEKLLNREAKPSLLAPQVRCFQSLQMQLLINLKDVNNTISVNPKPGIKINRIQGSQTTKTTNNQEDIKVAIKVDIRPVAIGLGSGR